MADIIFEMGYMVIYSSRAQSIAFFSWSLRNKPDLLVIGSLICSTGQNESSLSFCNREIKMQTKEVTNSNRAKSTNICK